MLFTAKNRNRVLTKFRRDKKKKTVKKRARAQHTHRKLTHTCVKHGEGKSKCQTGPRCHAKTTTSKYSATFPGVFPPCLLRAGIVFIYFLYFFIFLLQHLGVVRPRHKYTSPLPPWYPLLLPRYFIANGQMCCQNCVLWALQELKCQNCMLPISPDAQISVPLLTRDRLMAG